MTAIADWLEERGIFLKRYEPGEHRAPCPQCARGKRDTALSVRIDDDGATWICHRCDWRGGVLEATERQPQRHREKQPEPEQHYTLAPWGLDLWEQCNPILPGTPAAKYLDWRCCVIPPGDLRWHADLPDKLSGYRGPALVGLVTDPLSCEPINLHRTWLAPDGRGKAPIDKPRRLLRGHRSNGVIRLWPDSEVTMGIAIGEGIETCLAAALDGLTPVWATISAHNLAQFPVLPGIEGITILCDHDLPNPKTGRRAGIDAALALIDRYTEAGFDADRDIRVIFPDREGQDVNDVVLQKRRAR
jgi:putative DNA primase/helicase